MMSCLPIVPWLRLSSFLLSGLPAAEGPKRRHPDAAGAPATDRAWCSRVPWGGLLPAAERATPLDLAPAEQAVQGAADLLGQRGVGMVPGSAGSRGPGRDQRGVGRDGLADQAAVEALDLAEPADQVHAGAPGAGLELSGPVPRFLAGRADQDKLVAQHAAAPGALPPLRVRLPHAAAVTRQSPRPPSPVRR